MKKRIETQHSKNKDHGIWFQHFIVNRWGNNGNSDKLYFLTPKSLQIVDYSHEIKGHLLFGRKSMTNLDSILKSRDITLLTKVHIVQIVKALVFPVVMYGY